MRSCTDCRGLAATGSLASNEEGTALFEGVMSLLLFLPVWMFIIYIGSSGVAMTDSYQGARSALWLTQSQENCNTLNTIGHSPQQNPSSTSGGGTANAHYQGLRAPGTRPTSSYAAALGFPGFITRDAFVGCASYPTGAQVTPMPTWQDAIQNL